MSKRFVQRDISWLYFNERVLKEASNPQLPLLERLNFLSIYSSNLDEFYKVRIPALLAIDQVIAKKENKPDLSNALVEIEALIQQQQELFGSTLAVILPALEQKGIKFHYKEKNIPTAIIPEAKAFFYQHLLAYLVCIPLEKENKSFFPVNNQLYLLLQTSSKNETAYYIVNIPSNKSDRFFTFKSASGHTHILFIDDLIKEFIGDLFNNETITYAGSFKITRNADLQLDDEYEGDVLEEIEKLLQHRNSGLATRLLHAPDFPAEALKQLISFLQIKNANIVQGGFYHHLSDLNQIKINDDTLYFPKWKYTQHFNEKLFDTLSKKDILLNTPFDSYDTVLQFFNEAAFDFNVSEIYVTLYRVAKKSAIVESLISAAQNGKKVYVLIELKARFDEENNIKWAKKLKNAGVKVVYTKANLKVHAKTALIKRKEKNTEIFYGIFATGNFNETTSKFYTDHILFTQQKELLEELHLLFRFLVHKDITAKDLNFRKLLVSQFLLQEKFFSLIQQEIENAQKGLPAEIFIKLNNLEEKKLIKKLQEAAEKGVRVKLIVRSICCINAEFHSNISVRRVVDRFLEHGRIFLFHQNGNPQIYIGSADWMNRNIYRRIEVCVPISDPEIKKNIINLMDTYWADDIQGVQLAGNGSNTFSSSFHQKGFSAQMRLQSLLNEKNNE
ncbi:polyphosphate kinase 1 [Gynurincola endophyticus]|uniref:polyphosphate kinase 1 n=1 Tax=Gynurincola endophyticus TaxID=2479004 RepID=UPI000F8E168E|nr:polyphosphate kinase 1 [Gynurincola endophyticus]